MSVFLPHCSALHFASSETDTPKGEEEADVLSVVIAAEVKANDWTKNELICFSVDGSYPSAKLVKALRQRDLNVRSSAEWAKKFNCGFELQLEHIQFEFSKSAKVRSKVVDLREINKGEGDLALLLKDGEYSIQKIDGTWSISQYVKHTAERSPERTSKGAPNQVAARPNWLKVDAGPFSILAPPGWEFHQLEGVDSFVGEFVGDGVTLKFDFGGYSNPLKEEKKPAYVVIHKSIGGFRAKIVSTRTPGHGITGVYFRNAGNASALTLFGKDLTPPQQELALQIFETLRFGGPPPQYVVPPPPTKNVQ